MQTPEDHNPDLQVCRRRQERASGREAYWSWGWWESFSAAEMERRLLEEMRVLVNTRLTLGSTPQMEKVILAGKSNVPG